MDSKIVKALKRIRDNQSNDGKGLSIKTECGKTEETRKNADELVELGCLEPKYSIMGKCYIRGVVNKDIAIRVLGEEGYNN